MIAVCGDKRKSLAGPPKEAGGAAYDCADGSASDRAAELLQTSLFTVLTRCSDRDTCKGASDESDSKAESDMSVPSGASFDVGELLPTERSRAGAHSETIAYAGGPGRRNRDQSEFGFRRRFEDPRAGPCLECQSVDLPDLPVKCGRQDREDKSCLEYEAYCHLP